MSSKDNSQRTNAAPDTRAADGTATTSPALISAAAATDFDDSDVTLQPGLLAARSRRDDTSPARLDISSLNDFPPPPPPPSTKVNAAAARMSTAEADLASPATEEAVAGSQGEDALVASNIAAATPSDQSTPAGIFGHPYAGTGSGVPFLPVPGIGVLPAQGASMPGGLCRRQGLYLDHRRLWRRPCLAHPGS